MRNEELYENAVKAIRELFSDMYVSRDTTIQNLETLQDEINILLESLQGLK